MEKMTSVPFEQAYEQAINLCKKNKSGKWISLMDANGKILAQDIICKKDLPAFDNSAMDGFAFAYRDLGKTLKIKETIFAGMDVDACLSEGECYKIMTGAKVPKDADTIIPFENCVSYNQNEVSLPENIKKGNALRLKGEEQKFASTLFEKGTFLNAQKIAMLASQGISQVYIKTPLKIAVFSTGDELKEPWDQADDSQIYNVNSSALLSLFEEHGFDAEYSGVIPDNLEDTKKYFARLKEYDAVVTSGGISMGEADFIEEALLDNGLKSAYHGMNVKPGRPTMIGLMGETLVASMPGNPLAAYVNAFLLLIPTLKRMQGDSAVYHDYVVAQNVESFSMKSGRSNIVLGNFSQGKFHVYGANRYGSGMITPLVKCNALYVSDEKIDSIEKNEPIKILLLKGLFTKENISFWETLKK